MIIGFAGKAASGKTTAARHLAPLLEGESHVIPMAKVLRDEVEAFLRSCKAEEFVPLVYGTQEDKVQVFHVDEKLAMQHCENWGDYLAAHYEIQDEPGRAAVTVRRILQWWGTEYRRAQDPEYWTKAWAREVTRLDLDTVHVLVDDIRFMNELNTVRSLGGVIVKIVRPGFDGAGNHASETSLDDYNGWDRVIDNDGTLEEFRQKVSALVEAFSGGNHGPQG